MNARTEERIIELIKREVVPATGCTEPVAVALTVAYASSILPGKVKDIQVKLSANVLKNAMGVGIPGTGMIGIPIAIALGAVVADPSKDLKVLDGFSQQDFAKAKAIVEKGMIHVDLKEGDVDKLYIEAIMTDEEGNDAVAIISKKHNALHKLLLNNVPVHLDHDKHDDEPCETEEEVQDEDITLNFDMVYDFALNAPLEKISFILEAAELNRAASDYSLKGKYGHSVGRMIQGKLGQKYLGNSALTHMLTYTSSACDARMDGAPVTVMSNSGSGNQGITATLPVLSFAEDEKVSEEKKIRALMLSNLMVIYIKQKLGRLSALCGCVVAATGSSSGITYLMGGTKQQISYAIKNMVGNLTGMICDGAKPSCSMKVSSGVSSAMFSALLAMEHQVVTSNEGIVEDDVDKSIDNLTSIGREAMEQTDKYVLNIMTHKQ
ncbi:serine dehydratase subunit alpha family protein [Porphyromonas pogonae]|uniref:L-cysteine desulfidase family protein n=1 Tax=Porphyromonas pogonae TaxID=867595 RepID=UPI002E78307D|nr:L-serine ammonia-lyase, iron-sulfur-dependent, subunit alpha [Porphyromonas pogonae]